MRRLGLGVLLFAATASAGDLELLDETHWPKTREAAFRLAKKGVDAVPMVIEAVGARGDVAVNGALIVISRVGKDALPMLHAALKSESAPVRRLAVQAVALLEGKSQLELLVAAAEDEETRGVALIALARIAARGGKPVGKLIDGYEKRLRAPVGAALDAKDWRVRYPGFVLRNHTGNFFVTGVRPFHLEPRAFSPLPPTIVFDRQKGRKIRHRRALRAIASAIGWLDTQQKQDGSWIGARLHLGVGITGLVVLTYLGEANLRHEPLQRGIDFLVKSQAEDGCLAEHRPKEFLHAHAIATMALAEYRLLSGDPSVDVTLQRAADYLFDSRTKYRKGSERSFGWGYHPKARPNAAITVWAALALWTAWVAGIPVHPLGLKEGPEMLDRLFDPACGGMGYQKLREAASRPEGLHDKFPAGYSQALTAGGVCVWARRESPSTSIMIKEGLALCLQNLPQWDVKAGSIDMYYWYHGSFAIALEKFPNRKWTKALHAAVLPNQEEDGSWPAVGVWGGYGGKVYATAMLTMALQAPFRTTRWR